MSVGLVDATKVLAKSNVIMIIMMIIKHSLYIIFYDVSLPEYTLF